LFTLTTNMAFAAGFALAGPLIIALANTQALILLVATLYFVAAVFCWTLPASPPAEDSATAERAVAGAERAVKGMVTDLSEGIAYIRAHHNVGWSLSFLGITGGLVGILAILGPGFAQSALALGEKDFMIVVLPLGMGIVSGIICLNAFGRLVPRRRAIEAGMISMGVLLAILSFAGPISHFLESSVATQIREVSRVASVLSLVIALAFAVGLAFAVVSISSQTQLQEDLPEDVRGRVFGVLNMLVSIASLAPIIIVAPIADIVGRDPVILTVGILVALIGAISVVRRGPLVRADMETKAGTGAGVPVAAVQTATAPAELTGGAIAVAVRPQNGDEGR
jgi:MFS family permease